MLYLEAVEQLQHGRPLGHVVAALPQRLFQGREQAAGGFEHPLSLGSLHGAPGLLINEPRHGLHQLPLRKRHIHAAHHSLLGQQLL